EGAELAPVTADVRVVDVAIDDIAYDVAVHPLAHFVGRGTDSREIVPARLKELDDFSLAQRFAAPGFHQDRTEITARRCPAKRASQRDRRHRRIVGGAR